MACHCFIAFTLLRALLSRDNASLLFVLCRFDYYFSVESAFHAFLTKTSINKLLGNFLGLVVDSSEVLRKVCVIER